MQEFFDEGTLPIDDPKKGLHEAVQAKRMFPVLLSSALDNIGDDAILNFIAKFSPRPQTRQSPRSQDTNRQGDTVDRKVADSEPLRVCVQDHRRPFCRTHHLL